MSTNNNIKSTTGIMLAAALLASCPLASHAQQEAPVRKSGKDTPVAVATVEKKGRVLDAATGEPAAGVRVQAFNNPLYSAMTDENGTYTIKVPTYTTSLIFEGEGYSLQQVGISVDKEISDVRIYSDAFRPSYTREITAQTKKTALVTHLDNDVSIDNQLQTEFGADMLTSMRSGVPGQGIKMLMNGIVSLNSTTQPLIIIDGVIQDMQLNNPSLHDGFFNNILSNIMVEDIEKISVLKNGTAIYGAKAAGGVVLIETKRNKSMATRIDLNIGGSFQTLPRQIEMLGSDQYRVYASELLGSTGTKNNSFKFLQTNPNYYYYDIYHNNTDWSKEVYRQAWTQNYNINVQGGDDVANYNLSVGYQKSNATLKCNDFSRFNLRLNTDIKILKNLHVRFDASYSDVNRNMRDEGVKENVTDGINSSPAFLSLIKSPFLSPYSYDSKGNITSFLAQADDYLSDVTITEKYTKSLANPSAILEYGEGNNKNYFSNRMISIAVTPRWEINRDWSVADHFAFQIVNTDENYYLPTFGVPTYEVEGIGKVQNRASALAGKQVTISNDFYFNYKHRWQAHLLNVRGGMRYYKDTYRLNYQTGYNTGNDKTPNMSSSLEYKSTGGADDRSVNLTYYATAEYNYRERYYLSTGVSMDGSSRFGVDAEGSAKIGNYAFGFFGDVQAAWVLTNEKWLSGLKHLNFLKLNVGYDRTGNDDINSQASRTYFVAQRIFNTTTGKTIGNIGNTKLKWETTDRFTTGLQLSAFNNRLDLSVNYFASSTNGLISFNSLSYLTGLQGNWNNDGKINNQGVDAAFNVKVLNLKDWKWSIGASVGHYKSTVKKLASSTGETQETAYGATILNREGCAPGLFYGYETNGVFATQAEADAANLCIEDEKGIRTAFQAGDMKFTDVDGNGVINEKDMKIIGNPNPDVYGTIRTQLSWKRLSLGLNFVYSLGGDIYNYQRSILESGSYFYNQTTAMSRRWTHEGQQTDIPRATFMDPMGNSRFSDRWIENGSYLKLRNITLSYRIPIRTTFLQGITVWGAVNNVFTITKYLGTDPEFATSNSIMGIDRGYLGQGRSFSLGLKINL